MLAPLIAATIGIATIEAAERMMLEMLIDAAAALLATNGDQVKQANDLLRRTRRVYKEHRNDMARALLHDLERIFALNAQDEIGRGRLGSMLASTVQEQAREKARRMASDLGDEILGFGESMAMSAKNKYLQEVARACLQVDSGVRKKDKAIKEAVSRLASDGLVAKTYVTKDGRTVNVPVDVAIRRTIQDECMHRLTDQTLEIAELSGAEYVEVSSHIGARPSHAEWHGRIYQLHGSDRFPNFYEACHVGDLVNGYGGYNCRHHIGIWTEGMPRRWSEHPEEGTGYTNEEIYELQQQQRRYENDIRKLKRQEEVLEAQGYDTKDINARIRQRQGQLRQLIKDNDRVLVRQSWREQYTRGKEPYGSLGARSVFPEDVYGSDTVNEDGFAVIDRDEEKFKAKQYGVDRNNLKNRLDEYMGGNGWPVQVLLSQDEVEYLQAHERTFHTPLYRLERARYTASRLQDATPGRSFHFDGGYRGFTKGGLDAVGELMTDIVENGRDISEYVLFEVVPEVSAHDLSWVGNKYLAYQEEVLACGRFEFVAMEEERVGGYTVPKITIRQVDLAKSVSGIKTLKTYWLPEDEYAAVMKECHNIPKWKFDDKNIARLTLSHRSGFASYTIVRINDNDYEVVGKEYFE